MALFWYIILLATVTQYSHASFHPHFIGSTLAHGISNGISLNGITVRELKPFFYKVATAGDVENYSAFPLIVDEDEAAAGVITTKLVTVAGGSREGFASRKTRNTATGTWVRYSLSVRSNLLLHLMYSVAYNFNFNRNWLAAALCWRKDKECSSLDATKMYYDDLSFLAREPSTKPVKMCFADLCVIGIIGDTHRPDIHFKIFPKYFVDLHSAVKTAAKEAKVGPAEYQEFMKNLFHLFV